MLMFEKCSANYNGSIVIVTLSMVVIVVLLSMHTIADINACCRRGLL